MSKVLFLSFAVLSLLNISAQSNEGKKLVYLATFINQSENTRIEDSISFFFTEEPWRVQNKQNSVQINYHVDPSTLDEFIPIHPLLAYKKRIIKNLLRKKKGKRGYGNYRWYGLSETTGYIDNDSVFTMHSPRSNQFVYTQVAPLVDIFKNQLKTGETWKSILPIFKGYPSNEEFKGRLYCSYEVLGEKSVELANEKIICWEIKATGKHDSLGISTTAFLYNENIGLVEIHYTFYDGTEILLKLKGSSLN